MNFPIAIHLFLGKLLFLVIFWLPSLWGYQQKSIMEMPMAQSSRLDQGSSGWAVPAMVLPPLWVTGDMEAPAGTKNMGSWTAKVRGSLRMEIQQESFTEMFLGKNSTIWLYSLTMDVQKYGSIAGCSWFKSFQAMSSFFAPFFLHIFFCCEVYICQVYTPEQQARLGGMNRDEASWKIPSLVVERSSLWGHFL